MRYETFAPAPALSDVVDWYYVLEHEREVATPDILEVPANCAVALVLTYGDKLEQVEARDRVAILPSSFVTGPTGQRRTLRLAGRHRIIGVVLKAPAVSTVLDVRGKELLDQRIPLETVLGAAAVELVERVAEARSRGEAVNVLQDILQTRLRTASFQAKRVGAALDYIISSRGAIDVNVLSERVNMSPRQLRRCFKEHLGMGPKRVARIKRFAYVNTLLTRRPHLNWQDVTFLAGFYDQAHFIKEFKQFAGIVPSQLALEAMAEADGRFLQ